MSEKCWEVRKERGNIELEENLYSLEELMKNDEEHEAADKSLMGRCITGLTIYAVQFQQQHGNYASSDKVKEIRNLISEISGYWVLDDFFQTSATKQYLDLFDRHMVDTSGNLYLQQPLVGDSTLYGLYRYAMEMVICQGNDSRNEIVRNKKLIQEITAYWHCWSPTIDRMCNQIDTALCRMDNNTLESRLTNNEMKM